MRLPRVSDALLSMPLSLSTPAWALLTTRSTIGWAAWAALSIDLCISSGFIEAIMPESFDDESLPELMLLEPPMAPEVLPEPEVDELPMAPEVPEPDVDELPIAPEEPEPDVDEPMLLEEPMLLDEPEPVDEPMPPEEPAALLVPALLVPPTAPVLLLVAGLELDDEVPLRLPDELPVLPDEPEAPFWLLEPVCWSLPRLDCWSLPMLLPVP